MVMVVMVVLVMVVLSMMIISSAADWVIKIWDKDCKFLDLMIISVETRIVFWKNWGCFNEYEESFVHMLYVFIFRSPLFTFDLNSQSGDVAWAPYSRSQFCLFVLESQFKNLFWCNFSPKHCLCCGHYWWQGSCLCPPSWQVQATLGAGKNGFMKSLVIKSKIQWFKKTYQDIFSIFINLLNPSFLHAKAVVSKSQARLTHISVLSHFKNLSILRFTNFKND